MPEIQPSVNKQEILCAEIPGEPCGLVVFGASGDLVSRKLLPRRICRSALASIFLPGLFQRVKK